MNKKQKSLNNKGFSLVELIIVIAIMAVLVGVLAPQFMKYVERSRKSTDVQNVASIVTALETYAVDPMVDSADKLANGATVVLSTTQTAVSGAEGGNCTGNADKALTNAGITQIGLKSSEWTSTSGANVVLTVTVNSDGTVTVSDPATGLKANHSLINGKYE